MNVSALAASLTSFTKDGEARLTAMNAVSVEIAATSVVGYHSAGRVLIIGTGNDLASAVHRLSATGVHCHTLATSSPTDSRDERRDFRAEFHAQTYTVSGHLGKFEAISTDNEQRLNLGLAAGIESGCFDLIVEISESPAIPAEVPPPGYYWIDRRADRKIRTAEVLDEIPEMVGSFEKPKFFNYDPAICAHSRSGIVACTRCIDACPTNAIKSIPEMIEVDPHLCQGGGSCSTACPTGAITYAYPSAANLAQIISQLLRAYRQAGGTQPTLIFYDKENGASHLARIADRMQENRLPVEVEEVGSIGLDICLSALAYGASGIKIVLTDQTPQSVRRELDAQLQVLHALLRSLGQTDTPVVELLDPAVDQLNSDATALYEMPPASFAPIGMKRADLRAALEHLHDHAPERPQSVALPAHAPFGEISVNTDTCTLCMGCVAVCPAAALEAGDDSPKLIFIEHNCVQCGLCETACPEGSIARSARYLFNTEERMRSRTLNEDAPFHCRKCGKPFATAAMIDKMRGKLTGHWVFAENKEAMQRLEMCEDCRVKDLFAAEAGMPRDKF